jgi:hypothetical protein
VDELAKLIGTLIGYTLKYAIPAAVVVAAVWMIHGILA